MGEWKFPGGYGITATGVNDSSIEGFRDDIPLSVIREVVQNSMDAKILNKDEVPVKIDIGVMEIELSQIPSMRHLKKDIIPLAQQYWHKNGNIDTIRFVDNYERILQEDKILVLYIRDFNTTGLLEKNYQTLVKMESVSEKNSDSAGGSKGVGKAAPFAASNLRMVFYNSLTCEVGESKQIKKAGIIKFVSFSDISKGENEDGIYITQARGYLENSLEEELFRGELPRTELGTDIYIMGLNVVESDFFVRAKEAVLTEFLVSLFEGKIEICIDGSNFSKSTLNKQMLWLEKRLDEKQIKGKQRDKVKKILDYYTVLTSPKSHRFQLPEAMVNNYKKMGILESIDDAYLVLGAVDEGSRMILQTRDMGMTICEQNRLNGQYSFAGVFHATGNKINKFLKSVENVSHDEWSIDRLNGNFFENMTVQEGKAFFSDLKKWYKSCISEMFFTDSPEEVKAFGMDDLFPVNNDNEGDMGSVEYRNGMNSRIKKVQIKQTIRQDNAYQNNIEDLDESDKKLKELIDFIDANEDGNSGDGLILGEGKSKIRDSHDDIGGKINEDIPGKNSIRHIQEDITPNILMLKFIELNEGEYRILGKLSKTYPKIAIEVFWVGENGREGKRAISEVYSKESNIIVQKDDRSSNRIYVENSKRNEIFIVNVVMEDALRIRLKGKIYEIRA